MRILQVNKYHFIKGGADRVYFNTMNLLNNHGHSIIPFSTTRNENVESAFSEYFVPSTEHRNNNVLTNLFYTSRYLYNKDTFKNLEQLVEETRPDIAHLHLFYGDLSASILKVLKKKHIPIVHTVHDYRLLCPANTFLDSSSLICEKCRNKAYINCAIKRCLDGNLFFSSILALEGYSRKYIIDPLEYIDRFIFVSHFAKLKHIEFDKRYETKAEQLYNFTDLDEGEVKVKKGDYFLFFGRLVKEKGLETLLAASGNLRVNLKIAGSGPLEKEVIEYANNHNYVSFLGHQSGDNLKQLVRNASFVIVPSEWYENNPMTIIEAYAAGVPVIASRIGGIPEIVLHERTGYLFDARNISGLADVISRANSISSEEYSAMSRNCREYAIHEFSSEKHYNDLIGIYQKLLQNG